jgi:transcriptional regulator with XRE-family HTH domain
MINTDFSRRFDALPPTAQSHVIGFLEFLEWKAKHSVGVYDAGKENRRDKNRAIGARLLAVRTTLRQSIDEAAQVADVAIYTYEKYERGVIGRWPTVKVISYADTWNVSLDWLLEGTGTMFRGEPPVLTPTDTPDDGARPRIARAPRAPFRAEDAPLGTSERTVIQFAPRGRA